MESFDVLIVDDEKVVIDSVKKILSLGNYHVDAVFDAETALDKLKTVHYKIIITDLMLPKASGIDLIASVKQQYPHIPLILITGYATLENAVHSLNKGSFDFIPKPFEIEEVLGATARCIQFADTHSNQNIADLWHKFREDKNNKVKFYFLGQHSWVRLEEDGNGAIGIAETFFHIFDKIQEITFPNIGDELIQGGSCLKFETDDNSVHTVWSSLSGRVIQVNQDVLSNKDLFMKDPFFEGWLIKIIPTNLSNDLKNLVQR